jgi:hypothetical protein
LKIGQMMDLQPQIELYRMDVRFLKDRVKQKERSMNKKLWPAIGVALLLALFFTATLLAQNTNLVDDDANTSFAGIEPISAVVQQQVPISVTLRLPLGATGTQTVTIPMLLDLNIGFTLAELGDPSLVVSAQAISLVTPIATIATPLPTTPPPPPAASTPTPVATPTTIAPTATPTATATLTPTATPVVVAPVCPDSRAVITSPGENQVISGTVSIFGTATHEAFEYYKLEYAAGSGADAAAEFFYLAGGNIPVENDRLAIIDTGSFVNGFYTVRLVVVDQTGNFPEPCQVSVEIRN